MSTTAATPEAKKKVGARVRVQKFGTFLSSMIMPNIGAFIAWGLLTALFLWSDDPKGGHGPFANEYINAAIGPMVTYLLPILIAYTGGKLIHDVRGGVVGAVSTMGVILATSSPVFIGDKPGSPMFLGAMIMGPLGAWVVKKFDRIMEGRIKPGFEMLVNNFSSGIIGAALAIASMFWLAPIMHWLMEIAGGAVGWLIDMKLLPLASILIEPAKVLFLNNAINHGILTPLGTDQSLEQGKSILFLLEANPGPGLGILLAYMIFGRGTARASAPAAALIHALGGIHEIYFPYVLMKPQLLAATILGGMSGVFVELIFHAGLRSPAAPGSLIFLYVNAPPNAILGVTLGWLTATIVSLLVASIILKVSKKDDGDIAKATADMESMKGKKSSVSGALVGDQNSARPIQSIVFACDAGMGSSAMGASVLRNKIKDAGFGQQITVVNKAINSLNDDYDLLVSHEDLAERAAAPTPSAQHVTVDNFMSSPRYDEIVELIRSQHSGGSQTSDAVSDDAAATDATAGTAAGATAAGATAAGNSAVAGEGESAKSSEPVILDRASIVLGGRATDRDAAIDEAGALLIDTGKVEPTYVDSMHEREASVSTFMGNGLAIPHGTNEAKSAIHSSAMSFVRYDDGIDWNGKTARFVIGIAGAGGEHLELLQKIAKTFSKKEAVAQLEAAQSPQEILDIFGKVNS
ncbi:PTS mannitol transporter subunit IICBA [Kocuria massiliensis]|uniref:PTS mannitol transporter subunit IICBA n=1 Tax=Kocuria massiliensis TaxID=1926282 RepID=UPI002481F912|nr:PTS mannitol transporter subunit IICBA [Kocuria massiliensis]